MGLRLLSVALLSALIVITARADTPQLENKDQAFVAAICFEDGLCKTLKTAVPMSEYECHMVQFVYNKRILQEIAKHGEVEFGFSVCLHGAWLDPKTRKA